jgi:uncharacterized protein YlxW (UPF0749 family)
MNRARYKVLEQVALAVVATVLGLMLALGFRMQRAIGPSLQTRRWAELAVMLKDCERERDSLRAEVGSLRAALAETGQATGQAAALAQELRQVQLAGGLLPGHGPGVRVTMDDSRRAGQVGQDPNLFLLHDDDVLRVVNELAAAGAEAVSINGQRHIATTEIRCAGPVISINNTRVAPPIQVVAIGEPATLEAALRMRGGVLEILEALGIEARIEASSALEVPAYTGTLKLQYLKGSR